MTIAGEIESLAAGAWSVVASGVEHGITAGPDGGSIVAIIVPGRESADDYELAAGA
jgi:hypothetical protein